jgi:fatty-acyl-CoA synthase
MEWTGVKIGEALQYSADKWPDSDFVVGMGERITYADFNQRVDRLATGLIGLDIKRGDHVACWLTNGPDWIMTWLACCRLGATVVSINTRYKTQEVEFILRQSDAKLLVAMPSYWEIDYLSMISKMVPSYETSTPGNLQCDSLPELRGVLLWQDKFHPGTVSLHTLQANDANRAALDAAAATLETEDPVIIIYTSGTTGVPKGAMHCHRVLLEGRDIAKALHMEAGDNVLCHLPLYHVAGSVATVMPAMQHGATIVTMEQWEPAAAIDLIERERVNIMGGIPTHFIDMLGVPGVEKRDTHCLKSAWIGGAPVTPKLARAAKNILKFDALQAVYGLTETMGGTTLSEFDAPIEVTCENKGKPIGSFEVKVVRNNSGDAADIDEDGEIWVRGYTVMLGYYKNEEATREAITPEGWFLTGDLGHYDKDGYLKITGRVKEMFIVGGSNAYPAEIERYLETHPKVSQAVVCGAPHERLGEVCFAFVMPKSGERLSEGEIVEYCRGQIADYKVPRHVDIVEDFPRTTTNKIQRFILQKEISDRFSK